MKPETQARITTLLDSDPNSVSPSVCAAALAEYQKKQENEQKDVMVRRLGTIAAYTNEAVAALREARKAEKKAKNLVDAFAEAEDAFKANGDWSAYLKAKDDAYSKYHQN